MAHAPTDLLAADFFKDGESRPLKFGKSFLNDPKNKDEHISIMYDFKTPNSDKSKTTMDIGSDNNVSINVRQENSDDATVYKGSLQKAAKDCFLIVDHVTGEITLERVSSCVRVKRTREPGAGGGSSRQISTTPQDHSRMNRNTPPAISDSMPDLDFADEDDSMGNNQHHNQQQQQQQQPQQHHQSSSGNGPSGGGMPSMPNGGGSDSSGSSSSSSGSSSSDSDSEDEQQHSKNANNVPQHHNQQPQAPLQAPPIHSSNTGMSSHIVINDLELSSASEDEL